MKKINIKSTLKKKKKLKRSKYFFSFLLERFVKFYISFIIIVLFLTVDSENDNKEMAIRVIHCFTSNYILIHHLFIEAKRPKLKLNIAERLSGKNFLPYVTAPTSSTN